MLILLLVIPSSRYQIDHSRVDTSHISAAGLTLSDLLRTIQENLGRRESFRSLVWSAYSLLLPGCANYEWEE